MASFTTRIQERKYVIVYDRSVKNTIISFERSMLKLQGGQLGGESLHGAYI